MGSECKTVPALCESLAGVRLLLPAAGERRAGLHERPLHVGGRRMTQPRTFGVVVSAKRKPGRRPQRYNCGEHGWLTVEGIANVSGLSKKAIRERLALGWKGESLCLPRYATRAHAISYRAPPRHALLSAFRIVAQFPDRVPTIAELQAIRPMCDSTAGHWRNALATAYAEARARKALEGADG